MLKISSKQNAQLKQWRKLLSAKGRKQAKQYLIEGAHLIEEAIASRETIKYVIVSESYWNQHSNEIKKGAYELVLLADNCVSDLSQTETPQGIFAIVEMNNRSILPQKVQQVLLVDAIQDPGNLGTIIRTADAAGFDAIVLGQGTVDLYNDKVIRSTQGSLWHLPIIQADLQEAINELKEQQVAIYATALHTNAKPYFQVEKQQSVAIIVGNEGNGVNEQLIHLADETIYIPMPGKAESLNVAIASGILMFHFINA